MSRAIRYILKKKDGLYYAEGNLNMLTFLFWLGLPFREYNYWSCGGFRLSPIFSFCKLKAKPRKKSSSPPHQLFFYKLRANNSIKGDFQKYLLGRSS